jgi:aminoglycoside/choline kinase family phosphotransferase
MDQRLNALSTWVAEVLHLSSANLSVVSGDASFRRYFRLELGDKSYIAMDAPPEKEDSSSFVAIAQHWYQQDIEVPEIVFFDLGKGFLLLSDLGDDLLLSHLCPEEPSVSNGDLYYQKAMDTLFVIQKISSDQNYPLPSYDAALLQREMSLFPDWLLEKKLGLTLSTSERQLLRDTFELLEQSALRQSQVTVHRDYHARNLMVLDSDDLGVIDFQDAVSGPITYDLVSLLRDCYIVWPDGNVDEWCRYFFGRLNAQKLIDIPYAKFKQDFDWMGVQRHLKASGIFARLSLRDGKHGYLEDIPRTVNYIVRVCALYPQLGMFHQFLESRVLPVLEKGLSQ